VFDEEPRQLESMQKVASQFALQGQVTFLPTDSHQKVIDFYEGVLGLALVRDQRLCRIYKTGPMSYLGFCERGYTIPTDFRVVITLLIDDVDGVYKLLQSRGIATEGKPELSERFNVYQFFVRDPNGYLVEIQRFLEPLA
jgi:catechol 2,3-dioxygenase-like lactoylglutathione lyase family enzyme